jgi:hypothetical protein
MDQESGESDLDVIVDHRILLAIRTVVSGDIGHVDELSDCGPITIQRKERSVTGSDASARSRW